MSDVFALTSEEGVGANTVGMTEDGSMILDYGNRLETVLNGFDEAIAELQKGGMSDDLVGGAVSSYKGIKDTLDDYAKRLQATGNAVVQSAENIAATGEAASQGIH